MQLILGNKVYSSWSLRGWLLFKPFGIAFDQQVVPLYTDDFEAFRTNTFPARQVPTLVVSGGETPLVIWDSLSIAEFLHEQHPDAGIWPKDPAARAAARSLCAEMHSGFQALRSTMPMNLRRRYSTFQPSEDAAADIERVYTLWRWARDNWGDGGPYLFGEQFTAADAFFAPVAARFRTYGVVPDGKPAAYVDTLLSHPSTVAFNRDSEKEVWVMDHNELEID